VLNTHAPQLLQRHGVGPDSATALLITAGDNPDRMSSEASLAALCGVSPIEARRAKPADAGSTAAATAAPTPRSTASP
jgi:transposase